MARPRAFDRLEALEQAMFLFWSKGYEATSVQDLVDSLGINRGSLYDTFGDKHTLYQETLAHYRSCVIDKGVSTLDTPENGWEAIEGFFNHAVEHCGEPGEKVGCFLANSAIELSQRDPSVLKAIQEGTQELEDAFSRAVKRGQTSGDISTNLDAPSTAAFLISSLFGLQVIARTCNDSKKLSKIKELALFPLKTRK